MVCFFIRLKVGGFLRLKDYFVDQIDPKLVTLGDFKYLGINPIYSVRTQAPL